MKSDKFKVTEIDLDFARNEGTMSMVSTEFDDRDLMAILQAGKAVALDPPIGKGHRVLVSAKSGVWECSDTWNQEVRLTFKKEWRLKTWLKKIKLWICQHLTRKER